MTLNRLLTPCLVYVVLTLAWPAALAQPAPEAEAGEPAPPGLRFQDFFHRPVGPRGLELGPALLAANGRTVRLAGYMVAQEHARPGQFLLAPLPLRMSEHADGEADDLPPHTVTVLLHASQRERTLPHHAGLIALTGRLEVGRAEDGTGRVSWVRLHLPPQALAEQPAMPVAAAHAH